MMHGTGTRPIQLHGDVMMEPSDEIFTGAMTPEDIERELVALAEALDNRTEIWRVVYKADRSISRRIYRGFFVPGDSQPATRTTSK